MLEQAMIMRGRIVDQGAPDELIRRYGRADLEQVFLYIARRPGDETAPRAAE